MQSQRSPAGLSTPTRAATAKKSFRNTLVWVSVLSLAAIVLLSVWRLRDTEQTRDRRLLLSANDPFEKLTGIVGAGSLNSLQQTSQAELKKLGKELNVTRQELLAKEKRVLELEAENSKVRRGMDDVLTELHKLFINKTNGDTNALVEAESLRGELITAHERADIAEQRTKIAAGLMAACEQRIQANGSVQAAFESLSSQLAGFKQEQQKERESLAGGVNGTVHSSALQQTAGASAAEVMMQASEAEEVSKQQQQQQTSPGAEAQLRPESRAEALPHPSRQSAAQTLPKQPEQPAASAAALTGNASSTLPTSLRSAQHSPVQPGQGAVAGAASGAAQVSGSATGLERSGSAALETGPGLEKP